MKNYRKIYERNYGPIPKDDSGRTYDIHHIDGNRKNNDPSNLKALTIKEHYDVHYKQGDYAACLRIVSRMNMDFKLMSDLSRKANLGRPKTNKHNYKKPKSEEHKRNISLAHTGRKRKEHEILSISKTWEVTYPNGDTTIIVNLKKFCIENSLADSAMIGVSQGSRNHHKGFKVRKLDA